VHKSFEEKNYKRSRKFNYYMKKARLIVEKMEDDIRKETIT
jgi:hypothetical protein